jgi:hypothetical protein
LTLPEIRPLPDSELLKPRARVVEEEEMRQRFIHLGSDETPAVPS